MLLIRGELRAFAEIPHRFLNEVLRLFCANRSSSDKRLWPAAVKPAQWLLRTSIRVLRTDWFNETTRELSEN